MNTYIILCYEGQEVLNVECVATLADAKAKAILMTEYEGFVIYQYDGTTTQVVTDGEFPRFHGNRTSDDVEWQSS